MFHWTTLQPDSTRITREERAIALAQRIQVSTEVPCAMPGCPNHTHTALIMPHTSMEGVWLMLPLCRSCSGRDGEVQLIDD